MLAFLQFSSQFLQYLSLGLMDLYKINVHTNISRHAHTKITLIFDLSASKVP